MYREWRNANNNQKPNRALIKMQWEDEPDEEPRTDIVALRTYNELCADDNSILWYASGLRGLLELLQPGNGSDFVMTEVVEFYKK